MPQRARKRALARLRHCVQAELRQPPRRLRTGEAAGRGVPGPSLLSGHAPAIRPPLSSWPAISHDLRSRAYSGGEAGPQARLLRLIQREANPSPIGRSGERPSLDGLRGGAGVMGSASQSTGNLNSARIRARTASRSAKTSRETQDPHAKPLQHLAPPPRQSDTRNSSETVERKTLISLACELLLAPRFCHTFATQNTAWRSRPIAGSRLSDQAPP
jgi:hypothetical protein